MPASRACSHAFRTWIAALVSSDAAVSRVIRAASVRAAFTDWSANCSAVSLSPALASFIAISRSARNSSRSSWTKLRNSSQPPGSISFTTSTIMCARVMAR